MLMLVARKLEGTDITGCLGFSGGGGGGNFGPPGEVTEAVPGDEDEVLEDTLDT